jgi:hypothetical protein
MAATTPSGLGPMSALEFLTAYIKRLPQDCIFWDGRTDWTSEVTGIFDAIGAAKGYHTRSMLQRGEWQDIDCTFWPTCHCNGSPLVAIEHENDGLLPSNEEDFEKVCRVPAQLRVFIGYGKDKEDARDQMGLLKRFHRRSGFKELPGGETLLVVSWLKSSSGLTAGTNDGFVQVRGGNRKGWEAVDVDGKVAV